MRYLLAFLTALSLQLHADDDTLDIPMDLNQFKQQELQTMRLNDMQQEQELDRSYQDMDTEIQLRLGPDIVIPEY